MLPHSKFLITIQILLVIYIYTLLTSIVLFLDVFPIFKMHVVVHSALIMSLNLDPNAV